MAEPNRPTDFDDNQLFRWAEDIASQTWDDLEARPPEQAAQAVGATWDGAAYVLPLLGRDYRVEPGARRISLVDDPERRISFQAGMVLVSTLGKSLGVPPAGSMITPHELPGGSMFFQKQGPHAVNTGPLEERFGSDPAKLLDAAALLNPAPCEGGDVGIMIPGLPMIPLYALLWGGDDEFSPRAVIGVDAHAHHHLALDGVLALTNLMVARLTR
ncbi:MAG: DUF3786 domain-containing protein [Desulfarculaceae bacterium]|nr:DUF3786 domain-containing protein [Desulfarculaceae bacterium]MCF8071982.1 DUF3786 domain-containing protein [Desulfarculaceae bacterium]MCF8101499.1 DUF3786 domain-containing protein [Desulfarculaceae bacterium]MCF8115049.1 DUF3786 domain-containing protein [Desulfarculaceae bacterium]